MTLPSDVIGRATELAAALKKESHRLPAGSYWGAICRMASVCIRRLLAQLSSQDAEIERLRARCVSSESDAREYRQIQIDETRRAELAESRLAAADALLREAMEWDWLGEWVEQMAVLDQRIRAHLRGAGDD